MVQPSFLLDACGGFWAIRPTAFSAKERFDGVANLLDGVGVPGVGWRVWRTSARSAIIWARSGVSSSRGRRAAATFAAVKRSLRSSGTMRRPAMRLTMAMGRLPSASGWAGRSRRGSGRGVWRGEGERGDSVDDDEGVADDGGLDGGGAAGDDGGAGVVEGFAGVGDEGDVEQFQGRSLCGAAIRRDRR